MQELNHFQKCLTSIGFNKTKPNLFAQTDSVISFRRNASALNLLASCASHSFEYFGGNIGSFDLDFNLTSHGIAITWAQFTQIMRSVQCCTINVKKSTQLLLLIVSIRFLILHGMSKANKSRILTTSVINIQHTGVFRFGKLYISGLWQ